MKSESRQIGKYKYIVTQVSSSVGLEAAARLANLAGPGFLAAPDEGGMNALALGQVIGRVLSNPALYSQLEWFVKAFGARTQIEYPDGKSKTLTDVYDTHFSGEIADQLNWLRFAFEVNLTSFFEIAQKLKTFWVQRMAAIASAFQNPAEPSGAAGESQSAANSTTP